MANVAQAPPIIPTDGEEKFDSQIALPLPQDFELPADPHAVMKGLVDIIYVHGDERSKARAVLVHVYHRAIHGHFHAARDGLLMSHLQEQVPSMDVSTMILYNRAMAQLGLSAFRRGLVPEAHACLAELYGSNKIRELLAQGMSLNRCAPASRFVDLKDMLRLLLLAQGLSLRRGVLTALHVPLVLRERCVGCLPGTLHLAASHAGEDD